MSHLGMITVVVDDYDSAIDYYTNALGFTLVEDTKMSEAKRWVVVAPDPHNGAALLLAQATSPEQNAAIGNQSGGRVMFFLYTDDFAGDYARMAKHNVVFTEEPRLEDFGKVVVFADKYGNKWDFIERKSS
ncbi:MAG: VOC family protein [Candidatus Nanopelagicales bacterium]|jgi:catechol 2,3-dioxygenase-like lactoylglutathione lyase family enzyme|nr:VOC family protein [Candidatus Nanopelagicales bacterium]MDP4666603.1 VOC family protein [Candidatus Nanopelagicales bacterium]MDP4895574.1 VOC family protein [Candidatus Nanopelagicales bacterium]MDP5050467.1 VOC family protein [Candidatus Nanopelagicales bacterium]